MSDVLGPVVAERPRANVYFGEGPSLGREYSEHAARRVDEAVERIITRCNGRASSKLQLHRGGLGRVAARLREAEELGGEESLAIDPLDEGRNR